MWRKGSPLTLLVRIQAGTATFENNMEVPQDIKHRAILRPTNCTTGYLPHRHRVMKRRGTCIPMFIAAMSIIAKLWKEPRCPSADEWTKKMCFIYTMEYYSVIRRDEYPPFAPRWMDQKGIMLSEIKSSRERQLSYGFTPMWNGRNSMEDIRRRKGKVKGGNERGRWTMRDYWHWETNWRLQKGRGRGMGYPGDGY